MRGSFSRFWLSQFVSSLGNSFSGFALPLIVYHVTGSALSLAISAAAGTLPYLLFGLVIGVWVDRADRRRLMIGIDLARGVLLAGIPILMAAGFFALWLVYAIQFAVATLGIAHAAAQSAVLPGLVEREDLVAANGRLIAAYSAAAVIGPLLAGGFLALVPLPALLLVDAGSFVVAALVLASIRTRFNRDEPRPRRSLRQELLEGIRYVWTQPVIRAMTLLLLLLNAIGPTVRVQLVVFAQRQLGAADTQIALFASAAGAAVLLASLLAGHLSRRRRPGPIALAALIGQGMLLVAFGQTSWLPGAVLLWALQSGLGVLVDISGISLRQLIVPSNLLGRVTTVSRTIGFAAIPLNALAGGIVIDHLGSIGLVYSVVGALTIMLGLIFSFSALGSVSGGVPRNPSETTG